MPKRPQYNRDVRPILANHCFKCHGPDEQARQAGLRLDQRDAATRCVESGGVAIVPGKPDESELVRRICSTDADVQMPPAATNKPLSDEQRQILRSVDRRRRGLSNRIGHSLPPVQAPSAAGAAKDWPRNAIDHFILAGIEAAGLSRRRRPTNTRSSAGCIST